jgi:hypothetical protein
MGKEEGGSGKKKVGILGCLIFWILAIVAYFYMRRSPAVMEGFATFRGWVDTVRAESPWYLAAILGLVAVSPLGLIWFIWRRFKKRRSAE